MTGRLLMKITQMRNHLLPLLSDPNVTKELREMCAHCEAYCGEEHCYEECFTKRCFQFWLSYKYAEERLEQEASSLGTFLEGVNDELSRI